MSFAWERLGISKEDFDSLSKKLTDAMSTSVGKISRKTHSDEG